MLTEQEVARLDAGPASPQVNTDSPVQDTSHFGLAAGNRTGVLKDGAPSPSRRNRALRPRPIGAEVLVAGSLGATLIGLGLALGALVLVTR